jgi:hypothetical protein
MLQRIEPDPGKRKMMLRADQRFLALCLSLPLCFTGCAGGKVIKTGQNAQELAGDSGAPARTIDGAPLSLSKLTREGPVLLVFLRGFS